MKCFHCKSCGIMVFFENNRCVKCGSQLGFLPDRLHLSTLESLPDNQWRAVSSNGDASVYRNCANDQQYKMCNWMVPVNDPGPACVSCRLNEIIPDLTVANNLTRWEKLEQAKRRCIYTFLKLGLPLEKAADGSHAGLSFRFLQDKADSPVLTGHQDGVITINIAEADEDEREHRRLELHEPYRTLVGHLRHESGHYFWDRLIAGTSHLQRYRELFGDESADYGMALKDYYQKGAAPDWPDRTVTAYASSHPWEDWAETWAHYLHIMDTWETATSFGLRVGSTPTGARPAKSPAAKDNQPLNFDALLTDWFPLTCALNSVNRGMGLPDLYPFVISPAVVEKLRFVHQVVNEPPQTRMAPHAQKQSSCASSESPAQWAEKPTGAKN